jgi:ribose 5-phosphate isomerase A
MTPDQMKLAAAQAAIPYVKSGMKLGLGTGSTAKHFVGLVGGLVRDGFDLVCVPTSEETRRQAESLNIRLTTLDQEPVLDLCVDGADEINGKLSLIKGGGGALTREKIVATSSRQMIVIADETKRVRTLGVFKLPIEIIPFGARATAYKIERLFAHLKLTGTMQVRLKDKKAYITDNGNMIIDCALGKILDPEKLQSHLDGIPGVVDHGLFIGIAHLAFIGTAKGVVKLKA